MNINKMQQFEYALSVFSEVSNRKFQFVCEQNGKLFTGQFLDRFTAFPNAQSYGKKFNRIITPTDYEKTDFDVIKLRHIIFDNFTDQFSNRIHVPKTEDLVNTIYSLLNQVPQNLTSLNNFGIVQNVNFLESGLHFDSYRFPETAEFNVVSVCEKDN